jgi:hypothetical protein
LTNMYGFIDNCRYLKGWRRWLYTFASEWRFARRLIGGRWEHWWVEPCAAFLWHPVTRPGGGAVRPTPHWGGTQPAAVEEYPPSTESR